MLRGGLPLDALPAAMALAVALDTAATAQREPEQPNTQCRLTLSVLERERRSR